VDPRTHWQHLDNDLETVDATLVGVNLFDICQDSDLRLGYILVRI
jgi:hypothetical protein